MQWGIIVPSRVDTAIRRESWQYGWYEREYCHERVPSSISGMSVAALQPNLYIDSTPRRCTLYKRKTASCILV